HYGGAPQDIEWCIAGGEIYVVQARPITTLFPIPETPHADDDGLRVFLSFGHLQMMHDAMPRASLEVWRYFFPAGKAHTLASGTRPALSAAMLPAGGRLYIDATGVLRVPRARRVLLGMLSHLYEALGQAAGVLASRPEFRDDGASVF